ncbi:MAG: PilX N-terminal domain-containing pilus assembly protein [Gemmatimonadota bacterium]
MHLAPPTARQRGFALVATLFALVIIAALVTGAFFAAEQELRVGRNSRDAQRALAAAEAGVAGALGGGGGFAPGALAPGDSQTSAGTVQGGAGDFTVTVRRLNGELFLLRAVGRDPAGASLRTVGLVMRLLPPPARFEAPLTVEVPPPAGVAGAVDGVDRDPPGWTCDAVARDTVPAVVVDSAKVVWDSLVALARTVYQPADLTGPIVDVAPVGDAATCDEPARGNWGEPARPATVAGCASYFPVVYARGDLTLSGGRGQGLLLVEGDLTMEGGFVFDGIILARGALKFRGSGASVRGAIAAASVRAGPELAPGAASIGFSSCAMRRALSAAARTRPLGRRAWAELF